MAFVIPPWLQTLMQQEHKAVPLLRFMLEHEQDQELHSRIQSVLLEAEKDQEQ